ncbi:MAG TPA: hypothetical protein VK116_18700, partial [Planctomycetota bacterium]|nr:hypothetical protein [Planctomycetota bacterium]
VDTIILLSDGAPRSEANQAIDPRSIYALVDQLNRFRKTRIHTIGFLRAGTSMRTFLRELSKANDGKTILLE